jgi:tagatose 1,6-diphosphate aldolase
MFRLLTRQSPSATSTQSAPFVFVDAAHTLTLIDRELELVEPADRYVDDLLAACHHPQTKKEMPAQARTSRETLGTFLEQNPRGRANPDPSRSISPGYTFWMRIRPTPSAAQLPITMAGSISLRLGHNENLDLYLGHIGYHVLPPARGRHLAERACRLLLPLARAHGHRHLWITCNPDNLASRRTCERLGAALIDIVQVPKDNPLYSQGDRQKCRFKLPL